MTPDNLKIKPRLKIGLQVKFSLILTVIVLSAVGTGGWMYFAVTSHVLRHSDRQEARHLATNLSLAAETGLTEGDRSSLQRLVNDLLNHPKVLRATVIDARGAPMARAEKVDPSITLQPPETEQASLSYETVRDDECVVVACPVLARNTLVGGVRLVTDIRGTAGTLRNVQREVLAIAATIVLSVLLLGQVLIWRVLGVPIRRLAQATRRLADGDFTARVETHRNDELGELAVSFDVMAERLDASQRHLRHANESLERKVVERTAELAKANHRLRQEMAEKEDFLRAVSHDLNAPLRNIAGMVTMITMKWRSELPEEVIARLERVQANVYSQTELIGELLELSRVRTRPQRREDVHVGEVIEQLKESFEYELIARGISLTIAPDMPTLHVERNRVRQVFQNLIDNAIKYMGDRRDGRIDVRHQHVDGMHRFSVADNGPGVDPADFERIFHVFRRSTCPTTAGVPGKGVGLAFVRTVVANYEGRAWVTSALGQGATFHLAFNEACTAPRSEPAENEPDLDAAPVAATA